jgi:hypothetical protein
MELWLIIGVVFVLAAWGGSKPRITRWRGPREGSMDQAQVEHLNHFEVPPGGEVD